MENNSRIAELKQELAQVQARLNALREFMTEARTHEGDLFAWVAHRELNQDLPGADVGLTIGLRDEVRFTDEN